MSSAADQTRQGLPNRSWKSKLNPTLFKGAWQIEHWIFFGGILFLISTIPFFFASCDQFDQNQYEQITNNQLKDVRYYQQCLEHTHNHPVCWTALHKTP